MTLNSLIDNYGGDFKLKKGVDIRKLEQYKFRPLFTPEGKLIAEVLWLFNDVCGRLPILCITTETIFKHDLCKIRRDHYWADSFRITCTNDPLREKEVVFFNYHKEAELYRHLEGRTCGRFHKIHDALKIKDAKIPNTWWMDLAARKLEGIMFNVILTLMENGIIERTRGNSKAELNFGRQKPKRGRKKKVRD